VVTLTDGRSVAIRADSGILLVILHEGGYFHRHENTL